MKIVSIAKKVIILLVLMNSAIFAQNVGQTNVGDLQNSSWYEEVKKNIHQEEYNISFSESAKSYQSPNRNQNLRFYYYANGFSVKPRQTQIPLFDLSDRILNEEDKKYQSIEDWLIKFSLVDFGRKGQRQRFFGGKLVVNKNSAEIEDKNLKITYLNDEKGMRQDFIVKNKLKGNGNLRLTISIETALKLRVGADALASVNDKAEEKMKYSSLKVWDKNGSILPAHFEKMAKGSSENSVVAIVVNDEDAVYPITIDPLSTTASWTGDSNQENHFLDVSFSTGLDVSTHRSQFIQKGDIQ